MPRTTRPYVYSADATPGTTYTITQGDGTWNWRFSDGRHLDVGARCTTRIEAIQDAIDDAEGSANDTAEWRQMIGRMKRAVTMLKREGGTRG